MKVFRGYRKTVKFLDLIGFEITKEFSVYGKSTKNHITLRNEDIIIEIHNKSVSIFSLISGSVNKFEVKRYRHLKDMVEYVLVECLGMLIYSEDDEDDDEIMDKLFNI